MGKVGLVLEGGGMRGLYTCGVLEFFMEKSLMFPYIVGVSAGACNAVSYITGQKGRNEKVNIEYVRDWRYMSLRNLLRTRSLFGMDFIFDEIPNKRVLFDYEAFEQSETELLVTATDCRTGKPVYFTKSEIGDRFEALRASASLPLIAPIVHYKGFELLDGGIADSIPIRKSIEDGNDKNVIVLTRNREYRKEPMKNTWLIRRAYHKYPELVEAVLQRYQNYNDTLDYIEQLEQEGRAVVIRPSMQLEVDRLEKNPEKLKRLLSVGYEDAKNANAAPEKFLGNTL